MSSSGSPSGRKRLLVIIGNICTQMFDDVPNNCSNVRASLMGAGRMPRRPSVTDRQTVCSAIGSRMATHSKWWVIGKRSNARSETGR